MLTNQHLEIKIVLKGQFKGCELMTTRKNRANARGLILTTALSVFSDKGYDGARIDEISKRADVPKSLIYYHFDSKENLLVAIADEFMERVNMLVAETGGDPVLVEAGFRAFMERNDRVMRVLLIETLKNNQAVPPIYKTIKTLIDYEVIVLKRPHKDVKDRIIAEFFLNIMPRAMYACIGEQFGDFFGIEKRDLDERFYKIMIDMHGDYLSKLFEASI